MTLIRHADPILKGWHPGLLLLTPGLLFSRLPSLRLLTQIFHQHTPQVAGSAAQ